jgi:hypothetical protein
VAAAGSLLRELFLRHGVPVHHLGADHASRRRPGRVVLVFHIDSGVVEDVDVSDLTVAVLADTPPLMAGGEPLRALAVSG